MVAGRRKAEDREDFSNLVGKRENGRLGLGMLGCLEAWNEEYSCSCSCSCSTIAKSGGGDFNRNLKDHQAPQVIESQIPYCLT
jgi:hypothetical protein